MIAVQKPVVQTVPLRGKWAHEVLDPAERIRRTQEAQLRRQEEEAKALREEKRWQEELKKKKQEQRREEREEERRRKIALEDELKRIAAERKRKEQLEREEDERKRLELEERKRKKEEEKRVRFLTRLLDRHLDRIATKSRVFIVRSHDNDATCNHPQDILSRSIVP